MSSSCRLILFALLPAALCPAITGCGSNPTFDVSTEQAAPGAPIGGRVHGGQNPISGAHIYLMAANTSTSNTPAAAYGAASLSLLTSGDGHDSTGYYVLTNSLGDFNITSTEYSCTPGELVYALSQGGNPGLSGTNNNTAAQQIAILGACPSGGNFIGTVTFIFLDEVSTVAAAYSLAGYAVDSTHIASSGTTASNAGLTNAFATAATLENLSTGYAYTTTPAITGYSGRLSANGTVPQSKIYALANILSTCVNTAISTSSQCASLFALAKNSSGVQPTNVADAAINIAHNPSTNVTALYNLILAPAQFSPYLSSAPSDWTIAITFTAPNTDNPVRIAIDVSGNVWIPNLSNSTITELSPLGAVMSGTAGYSNSKSNGPAAVAFDSSGNLWCADANDSYLSEFSSIGASKTYFTTVNGSNYSLTFDSNGYIWIPGTSAVAAYNSAGTKEASFGGATEDASAATDSSGTVWAVSYASSSLVHYTSLTASTTYNPGLSNPTAIAIDSSKNVWVASSGNSTVTKFNPTSGTGVKYAGGGISDPYMIAVDGLGNVFTGNYNGTLSELNSSGTAQTGSTGIQTPAYTQFQAAPTKTIDNFPEWGIYGVAIDGSGNLWATSLDGDIYEFVGLANPVITPLTYSKLGTRP